MSYVKQAARAGAWYASFKMFTQVFSWVNTIVIARLLSPADYGLMAMASILTGYVEMFSEMGLGAALIQKKEVSRDEMSSAFWFSMGVGVVLSLATFLLAYLTAWVFNEPRVIPITKSIAVLFIISAIMIVPYNILSREIRYKEIGFIQMVSVFIASCSMLAMAMHGSGVWTLIVGVIIQRSVNVILTVYTSRWLPTWHYNFREAKPLLQYGLNIAGTRSLYYVFQKADKFIIARFFDATLLGYYSFAMQLASTPSDKIVSIVNQISFPVFSRYQGQVEKLRDFYLQTTKFVVLLVTPLFLGGAVFGREIILGLLGERWEPIIFMFQMFCLAQYVDSLSTLNSVLHCAEGRPRLAFNYTLATVLVMPASIYLCARHSYAALVIPWVAVFPLLSIVWTLFTIRSIEVSVTQYLSQIVRPVVATAGIVVGARLLLHLARGAGVAVGDRLTVVAAVVFCGALYALYLLAYERESLRSLRSLTKA